MLSSRLPKSACLALLLAASCSPSQDDDDQAPAADAGSAAPDAGASPDAGAVTNACTGCHGAGEQAAPPRDLSGSSDRARSGVGAHLQHLQESAWHLGVRCKHCHLVPATVDAPGHMDDALPAEVKFAGLAAAGDAPSMSNGTCSVYCHGNGMKWEKRLSPAWTSTQALTCTSCHAMPPAAPHPVDGSCKRCHLHVTDDDNQIAEPSYHVDGVVQAPHGAHIVHLGGAGGADHPCTTCHQGVNYHAALNDGHTLEDTTLCAGCHGDGTVQNLDWRTYVVPTP